jgi:hypothetical protein
VTRQDASFSATVIPGTAYVAAEVTMVSASIPSPIATPSPFTKEIREQEAVEVKPKIKLHVAEDAICESCQ